MTWGTVTKGKGNNDDSCWILYITQVREKEMHIEQVSGKDMGVDVVVDIFNRVNSGGTKLSNRDKFRQGCRRMIGMSLCL